MVNEMFDSRKNSGDCGCGPDAVAYLYGELETDEMRVFEAHLEDCDLCSDEIAAFSLIRLSIAESQNSAFPVAETTAIETPGIGLLDRFRAMLAGYPLGIRALSGALAALLIVVAGYLAYSLLTTPQIDGNVADKASPPPAADFRKDSPRSNSELVADAQEDTPASEVEDQGLVAKDDSVMASDGITKQNRSTRSVRKRRTKPVRSMPANQVADNSEPPRLSEAATEEIEDDSLRLTDLFAEVGGDD